MPVRPAFPGWTSSSAILYERHPLFIVLFSYQTTSYLQVFFTHPLFVPTANIFDIPLGCPNPCCMED